MFYPRKICNQIHFCYYSLKFQSCIKNEEYEYTVYCPTSSRSMSQIAQFYKDILMENLLHQVFYNQLNDYIVLQNRTKQTHNIVKRPIFQYTTAIFKSLVFVFERASLFVHGTHRLRSTTHTLARCTLSLPAAAFWKRYEPKIRSRFAKSTRIVIQTYPKKK